jgi:hypothetical protein
MSKAATLADTEPETQKNGAAIQNGSAAENHNNVDVGGGEEDESDEYDEDEEADYEVCETIFLVFQWLTNTP